MVEVVGKAEFLALVEEIKVLHAEVQELKENQGVTWVDREEAMKLTGRSKGWFYQNRHNLPIAMMGGEANSTRPKYSRSDCVKYGRKRGILPPAGLQQ